MTLKPTYGEAQAVIAGEEVFALQRASRGMIYGSIDLGAAPEGAELFGNGLSLGIVAPRPGAAPGQEFFALRVPPRLLLEAPVTIRGRLLADGSETSACLVLATTEEVRTGLVLAEGDVAIAAGRLTGTLHDVNPDALPLTVRASTRGRVFAEQTLRKPATVLPGGMIATLPFSLSLPVDLLDGSSCAISVRVEDCADELQGSPILVTMTLGASIDARVGEVERRLRDLSDLLVGLDERIVDRLADQYQSVIVPRVDAIVALQRVALERQMMALPHQPFVPFTRELPREVRFRPGSNEPFVGYGWHLRADGADAGLWFSRSAWLSFEIGNEEDVAVVIHGAGAVSRQALDACTFFANDHRLAMQISGDGSLEQWHAVGVVPRGAIGEDAILNLRFACAVSGMVEELARSSLSIGIRSIDLVSGALLHDGPLGGLGGQGWLSGFHRAEETADGVRFRWMADEGLLLYWVGDRGGEEINLALRGPMMVSSGAGDSLRVEAVSEVITSGAIAVDDYGWQVPVTLPGTGPGLVVFVLRASAARPSNGDARRLSVAVSEIDRLG